MRRCYNQTVSYGDGSSIQALLGTEPALPAQTQIGAHGRPIEPEFLEIAAPADPSHLMDETSSTR